MGKRVWTDETREQVRHLFVDDGLSYGQISQRLNMSRDVIAGLVNRMKLTGQGKNAAHGGHKKRKPQEAAPVPLKAATQSLIDLGRACCAWPIGDPKDANFRFCGTPTDDRGPYCIEHRQKAYTVSEPKREKAASDERRRIAAWS